MTEVLRSSFFNDGKSRIQTPEQYQQFVGALTAANTWAAHNWETVRGTPEHQEAIQIHQEALDNSKKSNLKDGISLARRLQWSRQADQLAEDYIAGRCLNKRGVMMIRAAMRLAMMPATQAPTMTVDYDGTVTDPEKPLNIGGLSMKDIVRPLPHAIKTITGLDGEPVNPHEYSINGYNGTIIHIPGSALAEPLLKRYGRERFVDIYTGIWGPLQKKAPELFRVAGSIVPITDGASEFFRDLRSWLGSNVTIMSANMSEVVRGGLSTIPWAEGIDVEAVEPENLASINKTSAIRRELKRHPQVAAIFVGDGDSDAGLADDEITREAISIFFARVGLGLEKVLKNPKKSDRKSRAKDNRICYLPYNDLNDVRVSMIEMRVLAGKIREHFAENGDVSSLAIDSLVAA